MIATDAKTEEFARLFNLFERLAARKLPNEVTRSDSTCVGDKATIPADLESVVKGLAGLVGNRTRAEAESITTRKRPRSKTFTAPRATAPLQPMSEGGVDVESREQFPLGEEYPFTFRLMLHKLYRVDDWAEKVKQVLQRSRSELAETMTEIESKREKSPPASPRSPTANSFARQRRVGLRVRGHSTSIPHKVISPVIKSPAWDMTLKANTVEDNGSLRVVKKRCIGRRKSMDASAMADTNIWGSGWIYDAVVAASEPRPRPGAAEETAVVMVKRQDDKYGQLGYGSGPGICICHVQASPSSGGDPRMKPGEEGAKRRVVSFMDAIRDGGKTVKRRWEV